jgi:glucokinase
MSTIDIYASVDLGGTNVGVALANAAGKVLAEDKRPTGAHDGHETVLERIGELVEELLPRAADAAGAPVQLKALGMGVPGLADVKAGVTRFLPNLPGQWRNVQVRKLLSPKVNCEVYLLNDARMATLGELRYGHGRRGVKTMVFYGLGTGVGGGVVVDGRLHLGPLGAAGELGHQPILPDGPPCGCGSRGCLETLVSGPAITGEGVRLMLSGQAPHLHDLAGGNPGNVCPEKMKRAATAGDDKVRIAFERAGHFLGVAVSDVVTALHPELVVIGGGVAHVGDLLLEPIRRTVRERVRMLPSDGVRIAQSRLRDKAGMMGGIALAVQGGV